LRELDFSLKFDTLILNKRKEREPMKRRIFCLILAVLLCLAAIPASAQEALPGTVRFEDSLGRQVEVSSPQRVAALIGSFAHIWHLAGGTEQLVAAANDAWTSFDIPLNDGAVNLGASKKVNLEKIIASNPDFILASANTEANLILREPLEAMGIPTAYFQVSTFEEYLDMLCICTQITGCEENYQRYGEAVRAQVEAAKERADGSAPSALYIRVSGTGCKVKNSEGSVLGEMLADLGAVNIADSETSLLENLSMEAILAQDPEFIFVVLQSTDPAVAQGVLEQTLLSDPAWQSLSAVREGRFHILDQTLYNLKPNDRWGEAYEKLAQILYPEA